MCLMPTFTNALEMSGRVGFAMVANCSLGSQCLTLGFIEETFGTLQIGHAGSLCDVFWAQNHTSQSHNVQVKLLNETPNHHSPGHCRGGPGPLDICSVRKDGLESSKNIAPCKSIAAADWALRRAAD